MQNAKILVIGSSGMVGGELTRLLREAGHRVRGTTSKEVTATDELAHVDLATGAGIKQAFDGIERAFFLSPPGYADHYALLAPLIQEAKRRGLRKVVLMTALGANASEATPFRRAEVELEKSGLSYNILRPNWFLQNFHTFWLQGIKEQRKILLPAGRAKVSFIDARDIAAAAAKLLTSDDQANQAFDLTGPESLDHDQVAAAIARATKLPVTYEEISPETLREGFRAAGLPHDYADFLVTILGFLREGYNAAVNTNVRKLLGREPRNLAHYAEENKKAWL